MAKVVNGVGNRKLKVRKRRGRRMAHGHVVYAEWWALRLTGEPGFIRWGLKAGGAFQPWDLLGWMNEGLERMFVLFG